MFSCDFQVPSVWCPMIYFIENVDSKLKTVSFFCQKACHYWWWSEKHIIFIKSFSVPLFILGQFSCPRMIECLLGQCHVLDYFILKIIIFLSWSSSVQERSYFSLRWTPEMDIEGQGLSFEEIIRIKCYLKMLRKEVYIIADLPFQGL